jgi:3-hydroxyisobutyrate dehydrogenase-like beta-hydroxyacid dehydrogenase
MNITMIGVGKMGLPMARHMASAGHQVYAFDPSPMAQSAAREAGIVLCKSMDEAIGSASVIISSLPNDETLVNVGKTVAEQAHPGSVYVDTSTVSLKASHQVAEMCSARNVEYLRSTVSGNNKMAEAAQLTVMISGSFDAYERIKPILALFGSTQFYVGEEEQARLMKLVINLMIAATTTMLSEALTLGQKGGLDWEQMWDVICSSAVASPIVKAKAVQLREHDYTPTFTVTQMQKDVGLILSAGAQLDVPLALTASVSQQLLSAAAQGDKELDYAAVIRVAARAAGMIVS